jgi:hypothetical protein
MSSLPNISIHKQLGYSMGQQGEGVNIRNPSTALFSISSIDRYNRPSDDQNELVASESNPISVKTLLSPYDFTLTNNNNLLSGFFTRLAVSEAQFRWTIPTLTSRNNKIYIYVDPNNNGTITNVAAVTSGAVTFTFASTTGFVAGQDIQVYGLPVQSVGDFNGLYRIASVTGTTLVCNNPNSLTTLTTTAASGKAVIRALVTMQGGWYDIYNRDITSTSAQGNMSFQFLTAVRAAVSGTYTLSTGTLVAAFACTYTVTWESSSGTVTDPSPQTQPFNCFFCGNTASTGASKFFFARYTDPVRPNAVSLFEMMAWSNNQDLVSSQYSSPNVSFLSTPFVDIGCTQLTQNQSLKDADTGLTRNILFRLFLTPDAFTGNVANLGSAPILVHRVFPFPKQIKWNADQPIGNLAIQVYDSQGYVLTTGNGISGTLTSPPSIYDCDMGDWTFTMLVSEV